MEELIDVCDSEGIYTGEVLPRSEVHRLKLWHRTAHVQVFDFQGRTLFQLRSKEKETFPGKLDISSAGHVSSGEDIVAAALRELEEELGLCLEGSRLEYAGDFVSDEPMENGGIDRELQSLFIVKITEGEKLKLKPQVGEVDGLVWFTGEELERALREDVGKFTPNDAEYGVILEKINLPV